MRSRRHASSSSPRLAPPSVAASSLVAGALLAAVAAWGTAAAPGSALAQPAADPARVVAERQEGLKRMGGNMEAIKAVTDARGDTRAVAARAADIHAWFSAFPARFPAGTEAVGGTKARPAVWSDRAGFERLNANAVAAAEALARTAATGDAAATGAALGEMAGTCSACHRVNRAR